MFLFIVTLPQLQAVPSLALPKEFWRRIIMMKKRKRSPHPGNPSWNLVPCKDLISSIILLECESFDSIYTFLHHIHLITYIPLYTKERRCYNPELSSLSFLLHYIIVLPSSYIKKPFTYTINKFSIHILYFFHFQSCWMIWRILLVLDGVPILNLKPFNQAKEAGAVVQIRKYNLVRYYLRHPL